MKRFDDSLYSLVDFILALILIGLSFPLILLVGFLMKVSAPGKPLFYRQKRYSKNKDIFWIYKFRTMDPGIENGKPIWSSKVYPPTNKISNFLRVSHIDELPQLFNVLRGEMSLVGPRPERPYFAEKFKTIIPNYEERYKVKAGMTGWAQIGGFRGCSSVKVRTQYDIFYIKNRSLLFNLKILLLTPFAKPIVSSKTSVDRDFSYSFDYPCFDKRLQNDKSLPVPVQ